MSLRLGPALPFLAVSLLSASAFASIDGFTEFDTTSSQDYSLRGRGLTLSDGTGEVSFRAQWIINDNAQNDFVLRPGFAFGITSRLELGAELLIFLAPDTHVDFAPRLLFSLVETRHVDVAMTGLLIFDFDGNDNNLLPVRQFGMPVRIKLLDTLTLFTGNNLIDWQHDAGGDDVINLNINVGLGVQVHRDMAIRFDTQIASINLVGPTPSTSFNDLVPLGFSVVYNIASRVDLTAGATYIARHNESDTLVINGGVFARF